MPDTGRPYRRLIMKAVVEVLNEVPLGAGFFKAGAGIAPDCPPPYGIVSFAGAAIYTGSLSKPEEEAQDRIQLTAVGDTQEQAIFALDVMRLGMEMVDIQTKYDSFSADPFFQPRTFRRIWIDVSRRGDVEQRNIPDPVFSELDQYLVHHVPG